MIYALEEHIGEPVLFCGRQKEMALLTDWANMIPKKLAKSRVLLGRRKSGKTALMQRLFNILWNQNGLVIPLYLEILEQDQWLLNFSDVYYRTFLSQYLSFKSRRVLASDNKPWEFSELFDMARELGFDKVLRNMDIFQEHMSAERVANTQDMAFGTPAFIADLEKAFCLVMIDEIQFMTKYIYYDQERKNRAHNLPGGYHGLVESKVSPMLVSGSYVGWVMQMIHKMFKGGRLKQTPVSPKLTEAEGLEAVYRYGEHLNKPLSDEAAFVINDLTQSDPFYIASLLKSDWEEQDFTSVDGAIKTLAFEIRNKRGELFGTWSEYIALTLNEVNDKYAKKIILLLSKERYKEFTRKEISNHLGGQLDDSVLEKKLQALVYGDLISPGSNAFRYCGIPDDILDLIFRDLYQEEIDDVIPNIDNELFDKVAALEKDKKSLQGMLNELKGRMLELIVYRELNRCRKTQKPIRHFQKRLRPRMVVDSAKQQALLALCEKALFQNVVMNHYVSVPGQIVEEIDVVAEGFDAESAWVLAFEVKNRDEKKPSMTEAQLFVSKLSKLKHAKTSLVCGVYLSAEGFEAKVEKWLHEQGVFTTDRAHWES
ncbi:MAG: hypothetical protein DRR16_23000 [Candidatus Parabeggiatoa sp. nov. 3]|nr:MAG: hypothetical protein DRR00_26645 [Gammaproteobacteria bacterium]RKZ59567.1 MAG: hypothetical protein DRQ99_23515 [Gammaproteobacteria bacterium]RKZ80925.1 MAG: hypothetical protein DRR16_23000 [Gammaproteobacteria bacterium]